MTTTATKPTTTTKPTTAVKPTTAMYDVLGPQGQRKVRNATWIAAVMVAIIVALGLYQLGSHGQLSPDLWSVLLDRDLMRSVLKGLLATIQWRSLPSCCRWCSA